MDAPELRLAHLAHVQSGVTFDSSRIEIDPRVPDFPYLSVANVQDGHLALKAVKTIALDEREARRFMLRPGDVLLTEGGDLDKLGRGTVWRGEIADCLHQNHVFAVRPHPRRVSADYLALATRTPAVRRHFQLTARKTTNLASTNSANIRDWPVPMPSLDERPALSIRRDGRATRVLPPSARRSH